ncbi:tRNA pseudouridine synthase A 1-like isoform X2 [Zingiber officinale]|uniref:tRNA pseudouridine synthase A 1-like isoform X2 n=1 Tax=Zingiber officinale TaxID=94328 RepID=UPI001C4C93AF|nr:tRNA pseudouridine synthase A 1-like isoform X2 [Zingiber officinale]
MVFAAVASAAASPLPAFSLTKSPCMSDGLAKEHTQSAMVSLPSSHKWRMVIAYDGTKFAGWQYQQSPPTIQCLIEDALTRATKLCRKELCLVGASRTDAGVHAWGQVAHFVTPFMFDSLDTLHAALNGLLPQEIRVREISPVQPQFHARFSTTSKTYHYKIYNHAIMDPFRCLFAYHSTYKLNPVVMREAAAYFVGKHDFTSFANAAHNDRLGNPVKEIFCLDIVETGAVLQLEVEGSGFLFRQVRNMVALLLQIGREALPADVVPQIISARDRKELAKVALSAPPHGLCLMSVNYNSDILEPPQGCPPSSFGRTHSVSKCKLPFY